MKKDSVSKAETIIIDKNPHQAFLDKIRCCIKNGEGCIENAVEEDLKTLIEVKFEELFGADD